MSDQAATILSLIEQGYTIKKISNIVHCNTNELFINFMTILKYQLEKSIYDKQTNLELTQKVMDQIENLIMSNKDTTNKIGMSSIKKYRKQLMTISHNVHDEEYLNLVRSFLITLENKAKPTEKCHIVEKGYEEIDDIIFKEFNIQKTLIILSDNNFDVNYINGNHLINYLIEEYILVLKEQNSKLKVDYYKEVINSVIALRKYKIKETDISTLIYKLDNEIKEIKRNKNSNNRKEILISLHNVIDRLQNKNNILIKTGTKKAYVGERTDFRDKYMITIDNKGTRNFDDALHFEEKKDGTFELGIHIADVNSLLSHRLVIDESELLNNSNIDYYEEDISRYNNPVSSSAFSLRRDTEKATKSMIINVEKSGELIDYKIVRGVVKINKNFCYDDIEAILTNKDDEMYKEMSDLWNISQIFRNEKPIKEVYGKLKSIEAGKIKSSKGTNNNKGSIISQEAMVLYNSIIPIYFEDNDLPFIYSNRAESNEILMSNYELEYVMKKLKNRGHNPRTIAKAILNLYPKKEYSVTNKGNSIMEEGCYCRATSPIIENNGKIISILLDELYFQHPSTKTVEEMQQTCRIIANSLTKKYNSTPKTIEEKSITDSYKMLLKNIRTK